MSTTTDPSSRPPVRVQEVDARRIAFAAFVGTALEWYDYFLYGTAAALVFNRLYFTGLDPVVATLAAFATFAVGFLARPIGAVIFGHVGDRYGRRKALLITVVMIGVVTGVIGLLPGYASIGIAAPVLLTALRVLQGIAVGGEWSGAVTLAVEHAPPGKRGRFAALPQVGSPVGTLLSSGAFAAVGLLPPEQFDSWGWRLPFLAAFPLLAIAVYLRRRVQESPLFQQLLEESDRAKIPVIETLRTAYGRVLVGVMSAFLGIGGFYLLTTFIISYGTETLGLSRSLMLFATLAAAVVEIFVLLAFGRVAERIGAGRVTAIGGLAAALAAFPVFWMIDTKSPALVLLGVTFGIACLSVPYAVSGALLTELFPAQLRYTGVALSSNLAGVLSGFVPLAAASLLATSGSASWPVALLLMGIALITALGGVLGGRLRVPEDIR